MSNIRYAEIQVTGRKESIEEFIKILNHESDMHFSDINFCKHIRKSDLKHVKADIYTQRLSIICNDGIWSMINNLYNDRDKRDLNTITFEEVSKKLGIDIQACFKTSDLDIVECFYIRDGIQLNNLLIGGKYYA